MILSSAEVEKRLSSPRNIPPAGNLNLPDSNSEIFPPGDFPSGGSEINPPEVIKRGTTKHEGDIEMPECVRDLVAVTSASSTESAKRIASEFGLSDMTVRNLRQGLIGNREDERAKSIIDKKKADPTKEDRIHEAALDNLMGCLEAIKPQIAVTGKIDKLSKVASDMSKVAANLRGGKQDSDDSRSQPRIILFAPNLKQENHYDIIDA